MPSIEYNEFKTILPDFKKKKTISVVYVLFINRFKLIGFNCLITSLSPDRTKE